MSPARPGVPRERNEVTVSQDGLNWTPLNQDNPVATPTAGTGGLRDPFIMRKRNGGFIVPATDLTGGGGRDGIWGNCTTDFVTIGPPQLFSDPGINVLDATVHVGRIDPYPFDPYQDSPWRLVPGLADSAWTSFRSHTFPDRYLRHAGYALRIDPVGTANERADATFRIGYRLGDGPAILSTLVSDNTRSMLVLASKWEQLRHEVDVVEC